jgi:predicted TPR repeat methyltransferase
MADHLDLAKVYQAEDRDELRRLYDRWADVYDQQIFGDGANRAHFRLAATLRPHLADDAKILDAGCGSGMVGVALAAAGFTTIDGLDLSPGMLVKAEERGLYRDLREAALGDPLDHADNSYDAAVSAGVFTPGHAPPESLDEIVRVVRPGGLVCFTMRVDRPPEGFEQKFADLETAGRWSHVETTEPYQAMPETEPEVLQRIFLYLVR